MSLPSVVLDTNILFSALVGQNSRLRETLLAEPGLNFFSPRFVFVELFKHKERIIAATQLPEEDLLDALNALLTRIHFIDEFTISLGVWLEARRLCLGIDEKDTPFVALTIHLDGKLWTEDDDLKQGLRARGFDRFYKP
jgi:predicted nucleic acid-binding protein